MNIIYFFQIILYFNEIYGTLLALLYSIFIFYFKVQVLLHEYDIFVVS